jgi:hypothetical protein
MKKIREEKERGIVNLHVDGGGRPFIIKNAMTSKAT